MDYVMKANRTCLIDHDIELASFGDDNPGGDTFYSLYVTDGREEHWIANYGDTFLGEMKEGGIEARLDAESVVRKLRELGHEVKTWSYDGPWPMDADPALNLGK